jgi:hypothetical protein
MPLRPSIFLSLVTLALLSWLGTLALPARAQTPMPPAPLSLAEYRAELVKAIDTLDNTAEADAPTVIDTLQQHFATITAVEYSATETVHVTSILDNLAVSGDEGSNLDDDADAFTPRAVALARLHSAVAQIDVMPQDETAARLAVLAKVLARPEFNTPMSLWDRFWQWLRNLISRWLPNDATSTNAGWVRRLVELVPWIVTIVIVVAVIWLLSYWLQRALRAFVTDARTAELTLEGDMPSTAAEARKQARAAAQTGNYRDAVRRLYLAALLQLAEHDLIRYERSLTNREVLVRVPADSPIRAHLEPVVATFDQVWYGVREPDLATFHAYEHEIDELANVATQATDAATTPPQGEA